VLTARVKGKVEVVRCLYWGECFGETSHTATSAYMVDVNNECIMDPIHWYVTLNIYIIFSVAKYLH
jgi:hypothetical protein